ncbi:MAG: magnesium transporter [Ardenticatenaceae bacterium]|nr:magnesium transporter [Ardenticatenaceae bacterium]HBY97993.1 magnesium transporter [Chloroflexota bacterium]
MQETTLPLVAEIERLVTLNDTNRNGLRGLLEAIHPADIAEVLDELSAEARLALFNLLSIEVASEVLDESNPEIARFIFEELPDDRLADLLEELPMDDAARLLADLPPQTAAGLIELMQPEDAAEVRDLLSYEESTAGRLMTDKFVRLRSTWTVTETFDYLRHLDPDTETIAYLYVVDHRDRLVGVVPLRSLVIAQPEQTIEEIMTPRVVAVGVDTDQEELAETVAKYDFSAIPVVDDEGRLVGIVTVDDVVDILEAEATEDIQRLGGSEPLDQPYFATPVVTVARKRIGWLLLLFVGGSLTSTVMRLFEDELLEVVALSIFIPLLIGTGGNAGSQTVSTIIRALAIDEIRFGDALRVLFRELSTGLLVGTLLGLVGACLALFWGAGITLAIAVGLTLPMICTWASVVGGLVPLLAERVGIDPAVVSAPLITTVVDATGLAIYFLIARAVLEL